MSAGEVTYATVPPRPMTYEQYLAEVIVVIAALVAVLAGIARPYQALGLVRRDWIEFLAQAYPQVESARRQISEISRNYYDASRFEHTGPVLIPDLDLEDLLDDDRIDFGGGLTQGMVEAIPRLDILLDHYEPDWFEEAMEPEREEFSVPAAPDKALAKVIGRVQKEAENAGRQTIMRAVDSDSPRVIRGWARVEGNENIGSCGFCAMLISRGPVYTDSPEYAGLQVDSNTRAVQIWERAQKSGDDSELMSLMNRWHPNCDCKVVPVFRNDNSWPGREQYLEMLELWKDSTGDFTGRDKLNAFRRALNSGDVPAAIRRPRAA